MENRMQSKLLKTTLIASALALMLILVVSIAAQDDSTSEPESTATRQPLQDAIILDRTAVSLAIYNQGRALVQDRRMFILSEGLNVINFSDVAAGILPASVTFNSLTAPEDTYVLEQNYIFDLVNSGALLQRYLDQRIVITTNDGTEYAGQLLSGRNGEIILRDDDGRVTVIWLDNVRDLRFPELPGGLITRPTLRWLVQAGATGEQEIQLTYLTSGMNWAADYNVLLSPDNDSLDLNGWITLTNTSGTSYADAQVKLIAGDVNQIVDDMQYMARADMEMNAMAAAPAPVEQRDISEYKLYEIPRPVTVADNETKQVEFVTGADVPALTYYVYNASVPYYFYGYAISDQFYNMTGITDVQTYLEFSTDEDGGLGADLPAGNIRVYQEDTDGAAVLIGENTIDHTPEGEEVSLYLGNAFDLVGERIQTNYQYDERGYVLEETYEIRLRNRKDDEAVEIRVPESLSRWSNWEIIHASVLFRSSEEEALNPSFPYTQIDSNTIEFRVNVAPAVETVITYTVRYTFPR